MQASSGIHHITAICSHAQQNWKFYTQTLGMRMVKKTVNFDDPKTYHLYYGDRLGSPGSAMTFFPWEELPSFRPGTNAITETQFAVPAGTLPTWQGRLQDAGIEVTLREDSSLSFSDPDGLDLSLMETGDSPANGIDPEILGFAGAVLTVQRPAPLIELLTEAFGMTIQSESSTRTLLRADNGPHPGSQIVVVHDPDSPVERPGGGSVHHIALRASDDHHQDELRDAVIQKGFSPTERVDRKYFHSVYFRESNGILIEIATDPPGFAVDESIEHLGEHLQLPPRLESMREQITQALPPIPPQDA
jgi:glyoxalase family protein